MNTKNDTLTGGRPLKLKFIGGEEREVTVRQLTVGEYKSAFKKADDEIALAGIATGLPEAEVGTLSPASYEELNRTVQEVNAEGFFVWLARQLERAQKQMGAMPPEMVRLLVEKSTSPTLSPGSAPRRG